MNNTTPAQVDASAYDDDIVRKFFEATVLWGVVGVLPGVVLALELAWPAANLDW